MLSLRTVSLLLSLLGLASAAGYKILDSEMFNRDKYPIHVLAQEAPGHNTWIPIDADKGKHILSQIAILKTAGGQYIFAKVKDGEKCVEFYHRNYEWDSKCASEKSKYSLFTMDFHAYHRVTLDAYLKEGCSVKGADNVIRKEPVIGFKNKNDPNIEYLLMAVKSNMRVQSSPKLIGTYDTHSKMFSASALELNGDNDVYQMQFVTDEAHRNFDKKKFEVFCPAFHPYQVKEGGKGK